MAQPENEFGGWDKSFFTEETLAPDYIGLSLGEAQQKARLHAITAIRVVRLDDATAAVLTLDLVPERLNLLTRSGSVVRAGFF
jgi:hypothetical protein